MRTRSFFPLVGLGISLAACTSTAPQASANAGYGVACTVTGDCRAGLACSPDTHVCVPTSLAGAGSQCLATYDCADGLYCTSVGACAAAGTALPGERCITTASCIRGAVCVPSSTSLYGTCQVPRGGTATLPDGGTVTGTGSTGTGADGGTTGTNSDGGSGGTTTSGGADVGGHCADLLDCLAGLICTPDAHECRHPTPGTGLPTLEPLDHCEAEPAGATSVRAYFEIPNADGTPPHDFFRLPFPNDIRRNATSGHPDLTGFPHPGTALIPFDVVDRYARASERDLDGFGTNQIVYFRYSGHIDLATISLYNNVKYIDLTTGQPSSSIRFSASTAGNRYLCGDNLLIDTGSGAPLVGGHTYAVILTSGIKDTQGRATTPDTDFRALLGSTAPTDARLALAYTAYAPLRMYLTAQSFDTATITAATVFTTQHVRESLSAMRTAIRQRALPTAGGFVKCDTGVHSPCDDGLTGADHVRGCIGAADPAFDEYQGQVMIPVTQSGVRPYDSLDDGAIVFDANGQPVITTDEPVCVSITIPHNVSNSTALPVVLYAHGTGGTYRSAITEGLAALYSDIDLGGGTHARLATVGYDGVMHGSRRGAGVTESPDVLFFNFANPRAARDNVLQGAADVFAFTRYLHDGTLPSIFLGQHFDPARILFVGHSQGATVGMPALPFEPQITAMVLSGAGGDLRQSLINKHSPIDIAAVANVVLQDPHVDANHPALNLFQAYIERADAVNYGGALLFNRPMGVNARPVVQTYGVGDTYAPVQTLQALAVSIGLPVAAPIAGGWPTSPALPLPLMDNFDTPDGMHATAAILEADPMGAYDGHFVMFQNPLVRGRVLRFLGTAATGHAVIRD